MIEVYRTNFRKKKHAKKARKKLKQKFPFFKVNFDLEDCDKILRVENSEGKIDNEEVIRLISKLGFDIEPLAEDD